MTTTPPIDPQDADDWTWGEMALEILVSFKDEPWADELVELCMTAGCDPDPAQREAAVHAFAARAALIPDDPTEASHE